MYCERCDKLGFNKCHCKTNWFKFDENSASGGWHGNITFYSYTLRWERKLNVVWTYPTIKES